MKLLLQWPAVVLPKQVVDLQVSSLDLLPTIVKATGSWTSDTELDVPDSRIDGVNLLPLLAVHGKSFVPTTPSAWQRPGRVLYWRFNASCRCTQRALQQGSYKWLSSSESTSSGDCGIVEILSTLPLLTPVSFCLDKLFDLSVDVNETDDMAFRQPGLVRALAQLHETWERKLPPIYTSVDSTIIRNRDCLKGRNQPHHAGGIRKSFPLTR